MYKRSSILKQKYRNTPVLSARILEQLKKTGPATVHELYLNLNHFCTHCGNKLSKSPALHTIRHIIWRLKQRNQLDVFGRIHSMRFQNGKEIKSSKVNIYSLSKLNRGRPRERY